MDFGFATIGFALAYLVFLFFIAWKVERKSARTQQSILGSNVYALCLAVYCTTWTFYGSVGLAAKSGPEFLTTYLGPLIFAPLIPIVLRKIIRIAKHQRINSVADFIAARYGKTISLGVIVTIIAILGIIPYISIQLKAISSSFELLIAQSPALADFFDKGVFYRDSAFYIAIILGIFTILFGTRHIDPNEQQEGLAATIAFESLFKLFAFLVVGIWVTFGLYDGFDSIFTAIQAEPAYRSILTLDTSGHQVWQWFTMILLSFSAIFLLPRQFHLAVVESPDERFVYRAAWLLPLYLLLINLFVLPIAGAGLLTFGGSVDPDTFVISLPMHFGHDWIALLVFLGGLSAATGMVIVSLIALSIMVINNLFIPMVLRSKTMNYDYATDVGIRLLGIRRLSILLLLFFAYMYFTAVGERYSLVSIGLVSFAAVFQFAPAVLVGMYWKGANFKGAMAALLSGFAVWLYTLPFPTLVDAGMFDSSILENGPWGIRFLRPRALFGLDFLDPIAHASFWSLFINLTALFFISILTKTTTKDLAQAELFVNIFKYTKQDWAFAPLAKREAPLHKIEELMSRFFGSKKGKRLLKKYAKKQGFQYAELSIVDAAFVQYAETQLAGVLGTASSHILINSISKEEPISLNELLDVLEKTQETLETNRQLEVQSTKLRQMTDELTSANTQLRELDVLKADFINTITHELRTPITAIRSLSGILRDQPEASAHRRSEFLDVIVKECERISRLVNDVLDLQKLQAGGMTYKMETLDINQVLSHIFTLFEVTAKAKGIKLSMDLSDAPMYVRGDGDRLLQVFENLISNALKFCPDSDGIIVIRSWVSGEQVHIEISDNGCGIPPEKLNNIFDHFYQVRVGKSAKKPGTGLGLAITKHLVEEHNGSIIVRSTLDKGSNFTVILPYSGF